jgi:hypothetical protein
MMMLSGSSNLFWTDGSSSPLFAGSLPSTPLASIGARQMARKTAPRGRVPVTVPIATEPSKHNLSVLRVLALNPIEVYESIPQAHQALRGPS